MNSNLSLSSPDRDRVIAAPSGSVAVNMLSSLVDRGSDYEVIVDLSVVERHPRRARTALNTGASFTSITVMVTVTASLDAPEESNAVTSTLVRIIAGFSSFRRGCKRLYQQAFS